MGKYLNLGPGSQVALFLTLILNIIAFFKKIKNFIFGTENVTTEVEWLVLR